MQEKNDGSSCALGKCSVRPCPGSGQNGAEIGRPPAGLAPGLFARGTARVARASVTCGFVAAAPRVRHRGQHRRPPRRRRRLRRLPGPLPTFSLGLGPDISCSQRHGMVINSSNEGSKRVGRGPGRRPGASLYTRKRLSLTGARSIAWCLHIHTEASLSQGPGLKSLLASLKTRWMMWRAISARPYLDGVRRPLDSRTAQFEGPLLHSMPQVRRRTFSLLFVLLPPQILRDVEIPRRASFVLARLFQQSQLVEPPRVFRLQVSQEGH